MRFKRFDLLPHHEKINPSLPNPPLEGEGFKAGAQTFPLQWWASRRRVFLPPIQGEGRSGDGFGYANDRS
jgi:hypothetical protein